MAICFGLTVDHVQLSCGQGQEKVIPKHVIHIPRSLHSNPSYPFLALMVLVLSVDFYLFGTWHITFMMSILLTMSLDILTLTCPAQGHLCTYFLLYPVQCRLYGRRGFGCLVFHLQTQTYGDEAS